MINFCVSLTTLPSRIDHIGKTLESINNQSLKPNKIFLNLPYRLRRFPDYTFNENQIKKLDRYNIEITRCKDYGPGTKLLGSLDKLQKFDLVIILDDDHIYDNNMFKIFLDEFKQKKNNYSFYVQKIFSLHMGQGADGILINTKNLTKINRFYEFYVEKNKNLFLNDDLWISLYLQLIENNKIIDISKKFSDITKKDLVYEKHSDIDSLKMVLSKGLINRRKIAKIEFIKFKIRNYFKRLNQL